MLKKHWIFFVCLFIFILLLAKNPFSTRTLIPNLEPYPDTIHYLAPPHNFVAGHGFALWREGRSLATWVPPLYSLIMIPAFLIKNDVRMFYFVNVILALLSYLFFYLIIRKLTKLTEAVKDSSESEDGKTTSVLIGTTLFLYVTNYFIYWYPTLAMGENLVLTLFLVGVWVMTEKVSLKNMLVIALLGMAICATKTANLPITIAFILGYGLKIIMEDKKDKMKSGLIQFLILLVTLFTGFFVYYQYRNGTSPLALLNFYFQNFIPKRSSPEIIGSEWFSARFVYVNLPEYIKAIFGGYHVRFLWDNTPIVPFFVGLPGIVGLILTLFSKKNRIISAILLFVLFGSAFFMSSFYSVDMRYLYQTIPIVLIGFALLGNELLDWKKIRSVIIVILILIFGFYSAQNAKRLKNQIMMNLKHTESPWYYLSVIKLNEFFNSKKEKKPYVITAMTPYYVDFFGNNNYQLLPMSYSQDFFTLNKTVWGRYNYNNLHFLYKELFNEEKEVYVLNYLGNDSGVSKDFESLKATFTLKKVAEGCYGSCNIWKIEK